MRGLFPLVANQTAPRIVPSASNPEPAPLPAVSPRFAVLHSALRCVGRFAVALVRHANRLLLKLAGGEENIILYRFLQVVVVSIPFAAVAIAMAISNSNRQAEQARIDAANQEVRQAVEKTEEWIRSGRLADADRIEGGLKAAEANAVATQKTSIDPTLAAFTKAKDERQAARILESALMAIAQKQFDKAKEFLREYLEHQYATERQKAKGLLSEIALATSDEDAIRTLLTMDDKAFAAFSNGGGVAAIPSISHPVLVETQIGTLKKNLAEAGRQREEKRKKAEAERLAEQKRIAAEKEAARRHAEEERRKEQAKLEEARPKVYGEGRPVFVGYTFYLTEGSWWSDKLSENELLDHPPNAKYLFVLLAVGNTDKKQRMIPPFRLVDENGAEYEPDDNAWVLKGSIGLLEKLNPGVSKHGFMVFDVPRDRNYRIKLSGGYWSVKDAYVRLSPKESLQKALDAASARMEVLSRVGEELTRLEKEGKDLAGATPEQVTEKLNQIIDELERAEAK